MRLRNILNPNTIIAFVLKVCLALLLLSVVQSMVLLALQSLWPGPGSGAGSIVGLLGLVLLSVSAYAILEHRQKRYQRPQSPRGAERRPLLPHAEDEQ